MHNPVSFPYVTCDKCEICNSSMILFTLTGGGKQVRNQNALSWPVICKAVFYTHGGRKATTNEEHICRYENCLLFNLCKINCTVSVNHTYIYTHELMVKPMKFLWLLLEIEVLKEEQADSILTSYHKISDTKSHTSFHFYATLLLEKCFGEKNTWGSFPFSAYGDKEL